MPPGFWRIAMRSVIHNRTSKKGFTLVELLVVITIIVILLALLAPALDQAIYQAELAVCGANQRATASGVMLYATGNKRFYPHREGVRDDVAWITFQIYNGGTAFQVVANGGQGSNTAIYDDRKLLRTFLSLNASLNDPLAGKLDFNDIDEDTTACASYNLWFGYRYKGHQGMYRIGDRMTWQDTANWGPNDYKGLWRFDLLVGDVESNNTNLGAHNNFNTRSSHPDKSGILLDTVVQNGPWGLFVAGAKFTLSFWESGRGRGPVDLNFASQDGSVVRYTDVKFDRFGKDERMAYVPAYNLPQQWQTAMPPQR
jgi:prepilin-type N-terminal cleavage/methylation domain-containing protein